MDAQQEVTLCIAHHIRSLQLQALRLRDNQKRFIILYICMYVFDHSSGQNITPTSSVPWPCSKNSHHNWMR